MFSSHGSKSNLELRYYLDNITLRSHLFSVVLLFSYVCLYMFKCAFLVVLWTGLEVIKLEYSLRLKIKRNDWLLADTCPQAAKHCALF